MREIRDSENSGIAFCGGYAGKAHADARRLVACWNKCDGIPIEDLEACPDGGLFHLADHANQLAIECDSLRAVNAELLEALKPLSLATDEGDDAAQGTHYVDKVGVIRCKGSFLEAVEKARAAIAKAQGEQ